LVAAAKFLVAATKILFVVPNFVAVTKPFFSVIGTLRVLHTENIVLRHEIGQLMFFSKISRIEHLLKLCQHV